MGKQDKFKERDNTSYKRELKGLKPNKGEKNLSLC